MPRNAERFWPALMAEEVGLLIQRWAAVRDGEARSLWPTSPHWVTRYIGELMSAQSVSMQPAVQPARVRRTHHFTSGGKLIR